MGMSGEQKIPECRSGVMLVGGRTGALTSGPSHLAEMDPPSLGLPGPGLELFFLFIDLGLLEGLCSGGCASHGGGSPLGQEPFPRKGWLPKQGISCPALLRVLVGIQELTGSQPGEQHGPFLPLGSKERVGQGEQGWAGTGDESPCSPLRGFSWAFSAQFAGGRADVWAG